MVAGRGSVGALLLGAGVWAQAGWRRRVAAYKVDAVHKVALVAVDLLVGARAALVLGRAKSGVGARREEQLPPASERALATRRAPAVKRRGWRVGLRQLLDQVDGGVAERGERHAAGRDVDVGNLLGHREQSSQSSAVFESVDLSELEPTSSELTPVSSTPCSSGLMIDSGMPYGHSISSLSIPSKNIHEDNLPSQVEVVVVRHFKSNQSDLPIEELQTTAT